MNEQDVSPEKGATVVHTMLSLLEAMLFTFKNAYSKRFLEMIDRLGYQISKRTLSTLTKREVKAERLQIKEYGKWVIQLEAEEWDWPEHQIYRSAKDDYPVCRDVQPCQSFRILLPKRQYKIGFVRGHGSLISNTSVDGLSDWGQYLEQGGFVLEDISHVSVKNLTEVDIVVAAPKQRLSEGGSQTLYDYFEMSGKIVYFDDVGLPDAHFLTIWASSKWKESLRIRILFFHIGTDLS